MRKSRKPERDHTPGAESDSGLWEHATRDVKRLPGRRAAPEPAKAPVPAPSQPTKVPPSLPAARSLPGLEAGRAPGLDNRTATRLRRGEIAVEARLDLHGMTQAQAHGALVRFVSGARADGLRSVLVITGKGGRSEGGVQSGVLRSAVPGWLNSPALRSQILAFTPAKPRDGGEGALYVLLKRDRTRT